MRSTILIALALAGCGEVASSPGTTSHRPGDPCLSCHGQSGIAEPVLSIGGTVHSTSTADKESQGIAGVTLTVTDASGVTLDVVTDDAGNFYTAEPLEAPLQVAVSSDGGTIAMPVPAPSANCNTCHRSPGANARALGWIRPVRETGPDMRPGEDCLGCHSPPEVGDFDPAPHFSAAGTIASTEPVTVTIVDANGVTVELAPTPSGNFYTVEDLVPPFGVTVSSGSAVLTKQTPVESGACNGCHDGVVTDVLVSP